jgi:hypothetical protein
MTSLALEYSPLSTAARSAATISDGRATLIFSTFGMVSSHGFVFFFMVAKIPTVGNDFFFLLVWQVKPLCCTATSAL